MKRIGVHQWTGVDPGLAPVLAELTKHVERTSRLADERWNQMVPSEKFRHLASNRFRNPRLFGIAPLDGFLQVGDSTLAEIRRISFDDVRESVSFLVHLQGLYVVDTARGHGEGRRAVDQIKRVADECGCGVTLFAKSFAFSRDGRVPFAMETFQDLWKAAVEEKWPVIYSPEWEAESLRSFYEMLGFRNMCLYDSQVLNRAKEEDLPFARQFVYLPTSMDPSWRSLIEYRLNRDLCRFCNR